MGIKFSRLKRPKRKRKLQNNLASVAVGTSDNVNYYNVNSPNDLSYLSMRYGDKNDDDENDVGLSSDAEDIDYEDVDGNSCNYSKDCEPYVPCLRQISKTEDGSEDEYVYEDMPVKNTKTYLPLPAICLNESNSSSNSSSADGNTYIAFRDRAIQRNRTDLKETSLDKVVRRKSIDIQVKPACNRVRHLQEKFPTEKAISNHGCKKTSVEIPENLVPSMVEAFRPLIEESIRVNEVLPYLPFLGDKEAIVARERESPKRAVSLLLDTIITSDEPGKWTTFINALKTVGYPYVAHILLGETELDLSAHRKLLQIFIPEIINNLEPVALIDHLYAKEVISQTDKEEIECELRNRGSSAASLMLLDRIPRRIHNWYNEFVNALRDSGFEFVANNIDLPELRENLCSSECSASGVSSCMESPEASSKLTEKGDMYITPENSTSGQFIKRTEPGLSPTSEKLQTTALDMTDKRNDNQKLTSSKLKQTGYITHEFVNPVVEKLIIQNQSGSQTERKLSIRSSSLAEFISEKRRLHLELVDLQEKRQLKRDIDIIEKQIQIVTSVESAEDDIEILESVKEGITATATTKVKTGKHQISPIDRADKATQVEGEQTVYDTLSETNNKSAKAENRVEKDITLGELSLVEFLNILKAHFSTENSVRKELEVAYSSSDDSLSRSETGQIKVDDLADLLPKAHTTFRQENNDSGLYSMSSMYKGAPSNYV